LSPEQKVQLVEEDSETKSLRSDESGSFIGLGDVSMSEVHSGALSVPVISLSSRQKIIGSLLIFLYNLTNARVSL